jgi:DnaJ-class molecular chaperone
MNLWKRFVRWLLYCKCLTCRGTGKLWYFGEGECGVCRGRGVVSRF